MLGRTAGGLLRFLSAWEFESRVFPEIPKFGGFASPARYFYFTLSDFSNMRLLFLITLVFLLCVQKSRTWEELRKEVPPKTFVESAECD